MSLNIVTGLNTIGDMLVDALIDEFVKQGHNNTGEGVKSIAYAVQVLSGVYQLDLTFNKYLVYQDKGVSAGKIPFQYGSGAKQSKYIKALTKWVMQRGMTVSTKKARGIAFAIAKTHKKEGMPSKGSYAFSLNGNRTGFFTNNEVFDKVTDMVEKLAGEWAYALMEDVINEVQTQINSKSIAA